MEAAASALQETLQSPSVDAAAASDAIKHLLNLQAAGLKSIQNIDPVKMYIEKQVSDETEPTVLSACFSWSCQPLTLSTQARFGPIDEHRLAFAQPG